MTGKTILVTGGTGFVGKALVRRLVENGYTVRLLIRPAKQSPDLPRGVTLEVAVSSFRDERSMRAAMVGVDTVYHLATAEWRGVRASLLDTDIQGTQAVCEAAKQAGVQRIFFTSHLGADRASAYPVLKAKAIAEEYVRRSGLAYTILRSGVVFGLNDHFTSGLARLAVLQPLFFIIPGDGKMRLQPLWVEDLATCLTWGLENEDLLDQTISIGGPEFLNLNEILALVQATIGLQRRPLPMHAAYLRGLTMTLDQMLPGLPATVYWLDYLSSNRTCSLDTIPRLFNLLPSRFSHRLDYLRSQNWRSGLWRRLLRPAKTK